MSCERDVAIMGFKDYTGQIIETKYDQKITILKFIGFKNGESIWEYNCPCCGTLNQSSIYRIKQTRFCNNCKADHNKSRMKSQETFEQELKLKQPNLKVLGKYNGRRKSILLYCTIHNIEFYGKPCDLLISELSCPECRKEYTINRDRKYTLDYVKKWLYDHDYEILDESEYQNAASIFSYKCKKCGNKAKTNFTSLLNGRKCEVCAGLSMKTTEQYKKEIYDLVGDEYSVLSEYKGNKEYVLMRHNKCGHEWNVSPINFLHGGRRCPKCKCHKGEKEIEKILIKYHVNYETQKIYDKLFGIGGGHLSYDFYLSGYNLLIEFQGGQHDHPVEYFGGEKNFKIQQEHDKRKREYAKLNKIKLLEIWYYDFNNIENILIKELSLGENGINV